MCVCVYMYVYMGVRVYVREFVCVCVLVYMTVNGMVKVQYDDITLCRMQIYHTKSYKLCTHTHTHTHTHKFTHIHTHTHTHTQEHQERKRQERCGEARADSTPADTHLERLHQSPVLAPVCFGAVWCR